MPEFSGIFVSMARHHGYLQSAEKVICTYQGEMPFAAFLKQFFTANKQMGSRDRKTISHLCYQYFRLGKAFEKLKMEERLILASWMPGAGENLIKATTFDAEEYAQLKGLLSVAIADPDFDLLRFPFPASLSKGIDPREFAASMAHQPDLFLRCRPRQMKKVKAQLERSAIAFEALQGEGLRLANATQLPVDFPLDASAVVQDYSSQQTGQLLVNCIKQHGFAAKKVWDACAASGGKSIMLTDLLPPFHLTVSDIRTSILHNLKNRFQKAAIYGFQLFQADLTARIDKVPGAPFDMVLTDVPCTGSGTWARTPEQLHYFKESAISDYAKRQLAIAQNAARHLKPGGWLVYITCSVFREENEAVVEVLQQSLQAEVLLQQAIPGYQHHADSMFMAVLKKP